MTFFEMYYKQLTLYKNTVRWQLQREWINLHIAARVADNLKRPFGVED